MPSLCSTFRSRPKYFFLYCLFLKGLLTVTTTIKYCRFYFKKGNWQTLPILIPLMYVKSAYRLGLNVMNNFQHLTHKRNLFWSYLAKAKNSDTSYIGWIRMSTSILTFLYSYKSAHKKVSFLLISYICWSCEFMFTFLRALLITFFGVRWTHTYYFSYQFSVLSVSMTISI